MTPFYCFFALSWFVGAGVLLILAPILLWIEAAVSRWWVVGLTVGLLVSAFAMSEGLHLLGVCV